MKTVLLLVVSVILVPIVQAVDTTPPTLDIQYTWMEKQGALTRFKMLLDPQDETGFGQFPTATVIQFRSKLNTTAALPASTPWNDYPWIRGEPFDIPFNCTSVVFELRAKDAAGNVSPLQRRAFASPFPFSPPPNLKPQISPGEQFIGSAQNIGGLFVGRFDGVGTGDDLVQVDRATGGVMVRRQINNQPTKSDVSFALPANTIEDSASADFDTDSRADLAIIASGALTVYHNDGLDGDGVVQFGAQTVSLTGTGITTFNHIAVGDVTGDGKLDIVVSGTDSGGSPRIGWLIANATWQYDLSSGVSAPPGSTPGKLALGDMNGDGALDVVMVDAAQNQMIVFKNKGAGVIAGDDETDADFQPVLIPTGLGQAGPNPSFPLIAAPVRALTVGDVTGDGRPDILAMFSELLFTNPLDSNDGRTQQRWRLYENRGAAGFRPFTDQLLGQSLESQTVREDIPSDVMLMELNNDRFPELLFTNYYGNTVKIIRFTALLDGSNFLTTLDDGSGNPELDEQDYAPKVITGAPALIGPSRLAKGKYRSSSDVNSLAIAFAGSNDVRWELNATRASSKPHDIQGGATTDSDAAGVAGANGAFSYTEYPGGGITYSLTYINNTATPLTGVTLESALPAEFLLQSHDEGGVVTGTGASRVIRWLLDVPENSAGVKSFRVKLIATAKVASLAPKIILKQGTKTLVTSTMPLVKVSATNFTVVPNSPDQPWLFTYKPSFLPENGVAAVQTSPDGVNWTLIFSNNMTQIPGTIPVCTLTATDVSTTSRYFRAFTWSNTTGYKYSSVFNNFLPPTEGFKVSTKSPPKSGQSWTFSATQTTTAANASVRFQSTLTPGDEGSWTDLPVYTAIVRKTNTWTFVTNNVPSGNRSFRAISAAPGWVDSISQSIGPVNVADSPLVLGEFSKFHADFVGPPVRNGDQATFIAVIPSVKGIRVRFQSKLASESDLYWTDLPDGAAAQAGTTWTLKTKYMPVGDRNFRAIASAPGYYDKLSIVRSWIVDPPLPQYPTIFGAPFSVNGPVLKANQDNQFKVIAVDSNGINRVYIESLVGTKFTRVGGPDMAAPAPGGFFYTTNLVFPGSGTYTLRAVVVDNYNPAQTLYSKEISVLVGLGNGTTTPTIGSITWALTQATAKTRGAIKISAPIGDDKQVYRAFLHRTTAEGAYISTVGEMVRAGNANPATFSFTHSNLTDSTYAYRIVAHDFDGNETISNTVPPIAVTTPAPEPGPIHLDIAYSSRFGPPTMPATSGNYKHMPVQSSGLISFTYSGLPAGGAQFFAFRISDEYDSPTNWNTDYYFWTGSTTTTSGEFKNIKAPFWTHGSTHPNEGEGTYRIVACVGGKELPHGSGVRDFVIGHAWNHPHSFSKLDWGLYWFKSQTNGLRCRNNQDDEYFDRSKPTVIYVHGWQADEVNVRRRESWARQDPYKDPTYYNMCKIWRDRGYNVGMFNWNQFANSGGPNGLLFSQANIYYIATEEGLPAGHSMIYALSPKTGETRRFCDEDGSDSPILGKTVCDLFTDELRRCMAGYTASNTKDFRLIGHSLGTQVVGRSAELLRQYPQWGVPLPRRIALLEIAQIPGFDNPIDVPLTQRQFLENLVGAGVALECYQSTDLQSILGLNLAFVGPVHDMAAYARYRPDYILPVMIAQTHNDIVRWYMESMDWEFNAYTYWAPFCPQDYVGKALSASTSTSRVKSLMGGPYWFEQSEGKNSGAIKDDVFERKNR